MKAKYVIEYWGKDQKDILTRISSSPRTVKVYGRSWTPKVKRLESKGCQVLAVYEVSGYTRVPVC